MTRELTTEQKARGAAAAYLEDVLHKGDVFIVKCEEVGLDRFKVTADTDQGGVIAIVERYDDTGFEVVSTQQGRGAR